MASQVTASQGVNAGNATVHSGDNPHQGAVELVVSNCLTQNDQAHRHCGARDALN